MFVKFSCNTLLHDNGGARIQWVSFNTRGSRELGGRKKTRLSTVTRDCIIDSLCVLNRMPLSTGNFRHGLIDTVIIIKSRGIRNKKMTM